MSRRLITAFALTSFAGCKSLQSTLGEGGPAAERLGELSGWIYFAFIAVTVVMWVLIAFIGLRRRGSFDEHAPVDAGGGQGWILIGGFLVPLVMLTVIFVRGLTVMAAFPLHDGESEQDAEIRITGHQWWWQLDYQIGPLHDRFRTANEIHIPTGRPVTIELTSADVIHSFWIPRLHGKVDLIPGAKTSIRIQAEEPGVFHGQCAEFCGVQHAKMKLLLVAEPPHQFQQWLDEQRQEAAQPGTEDAVLGQAVLLDHACPLCHTIRGTQARGSVGPDITHLAGRQMIGANILERNTANVAAWATHAQSLKPGSKMPNLTQFRGRELRLLTTYLQSLR